MEEYYRTVRESVRVKTPIGACRFFSSVKRVSTDDEARSFIESVSQEFREATHNAWGYKLLTAGDIITRFSDDREPSGTAGPPIIQAIDSAEVLNTVVVVTRFYGGVKLGVGGLIRAYRQSAADGLAAAGVEQVPVLREIVIKTLSYSILGTVLYELETCKGVVKSVDHGDILSVRAVIFPKYIQRIRDRVTDLTRGQGEVSFV